MDLNERKVKKIRTKFLVFSFLGFLLLSLVSLLILNFHEKEIQRQKFFQEYTSLLRDELRQVRKIDFNFKRESEQKSAERKKDLLLIQKSLSKRTKENLPYFDSYPNFSQELDEFHSLINEHLRSTYEGKTFEKSHKKREAQFEKMMDTFLIQLRRLRDEGRFHIRNLGWITVGISFLLVLIFWFLIFKPLFTTIFEQNLRISQYVEEIEEVSIAKENFLMNISHEIRTPMTAILGYADLLKNNEIHMEDVPKTIGVIDKNANHLLTLIDELLDLNKVRTDKFEYVLEEVNLHNLINEVFSLMKAKALSKEIDLELNPTTNLPEEIQTDPTRLKQILLNILGNAIKFTEQGKVTLQISEEDDRIDFLVIDEGSGIPKDKWESIFKPFEQADNSSQRAHQGTGLGLVLAKELAQGLGGDVTILRSEVDVGSSFLIQIKSGKTENTKKTPLRTSIKVEEDSQGKKYNLSDLSILVVDDAKENTRLFKMFLESAGAKVFTAHDGFQALEITKGEDLSLIFLDLQMPKLDGFETLKKLSEEGCKVPVVALTAHGMSSEKERTKKAGFVRHVVKPVSSQELKKTAYELTR